MSEDDSRKTGEPSVKKWLQFHLALATSIIAFMSWAIPMHYSVQGRLSELEKTRKEYDIFVTDVRRYMDINDDGAFADPRNRLGTKRTIDIYGTPRTVFEEAFKRLYDRNPSLVK